jgi:hypothetical protein
MDKRNCFDFFLSNLSITEINMNKLKYLSMPVIAAALCLPTLANADKETVKVACSIAITTSGAARGGSYNKDFVLSPGAGFIEDFKDPIHFDSFDASLAREAGNLVASINYFRDVTVFDSVGLTARLTVANGRGIHSTSGTNEFSTSLGTSRSFQTSYTLTCRRQ